MNPNELPENLIALKLIGNPVHMKAKGRLSEYRKPIVLHLEELNDLDKIEVQVHERMTYQGLLRADKRFNIDEMLMK